MLISEGGSGNFSPWCVVKHFHYELLRKSFQFTLLNYMETHIGKSFKKVKSFIYKNCQNGFYVYAKPTLTNNQNVLKYIGRYLGRPVIEFVYIKRKKTFPHPSKCLENVYFLVISFYPLLRKCGHEMTLLQFYLRGTPFFENYKNLVNSS